MTTILDIWIENKRFIEEKSLEQVMAICGDGKLRDDNETSSQLREYFANIPTKLIDLYINECLDSGFQHSGLILQDLVNEIGQRLGFAVEPGYYRGGGTKIGFDGLWRAKDGFSFVIEVKTTDAYQLNLDVQANYRRKLVEEERIDDLESSIIIVVGRNDTGGLEAQTRGSRHAWDIRIISVESLLKLLRVKENLSDVGIVSKIQEILKPLEYTRVDRLIDIIFSASEDFLIDDENEEEPTRKSLPANYNAECVERVSTHLKSPLIKQGRTTYNNASQTLNVLCIVSKEYKRSTASRYWFSFHPSQQEFLVEKEGAYVALGCGSIEQIILIPYQEFEKHLSTMRTTESRDRFYWHVEIFNKGGRLLLNKSTKEGIDVTHYRLK